MKIVAFIDYDNLEQSQKETGISDIITKVLLSTNFDHADINGDCNVRIYGGWLEGHTLTQSAQILSAKIQKDFPIIIKVSDKSPKIRFKTNAELALAMMVEPKHDLGSTFRKKGKPKNIKVQDPSMIGCTETLCPLPMAKKLLKSGKCPVQTCSADESDNLIFRHEQKIVDTMLTCDMLHAQKTGCDIIILISSDDDFIPPIRSVLHHGTRVVRCHPRPNLSRQAIKGFERHLTEMDLKPCI